MPIEVIIAITVGTIAIFGAIFKTYKYYEDKLKNHLIKDYQRNLTESFEVVVAKLSSNKISEKISSAILLRKFFDKNSSLGVGDAPLTQDTINVISSMLKIEPTGNFQKLLADSLKYASSLKDADLQETNLTKAVLGKDNLDFSGADFYRANLTDASFKDKEGNGVNLKDSVFYESILHNTNFTGSDLEGASFYNASFKNTKFNNCTNLPTEVEEYIKLQGIQQNDKKRKKIFVSHPRIKTTEQQMFFEFTCNKMINQGFELELIEKLEEQNHAILTRIKDKIDLCAGMLIFDFIQYKIINGTYRWWDKEEYKELNNVHLSSPWIYVEAGMAIMKEIPIYIVTDLIDNECIFNEVSEKNILNINNYKYDSMEVLSKGLDFWITSKLK